MKTKTFALQYTTQQQTGGVGVIIAAAGSAERMGGVNKLFAPLNGVPVLAHTLLAFQNHPLVQCVVVVTKSQSVLQVQQLAEKFKLTKVSDILPGGQTRAESVKIGFDFIQKSGVNTVLIHDGARPLVSEKVISRVIAGVEEFSAAAAAVPLKDAIKQTNSLGKILKNVERSSLCRAFALPITKTRCKPLSWPILPTIAPLWSRPVTRFTPCRAIIKTLKLLRRRI